MLKQHEISNKWHIRLLHNPLESAGITTNYQELGFLPGGEIIKAIAVQDLKAQIQRDIYRPSLDDKNGMLPPKVARMMINLAVGSQVEANIYDPFCGSGTVLTESMTMGLNPVGSDNSQKAIDDTIKNCQWTKDTVAKSASFKVFLHDVVTKPVIKPVEAIVFEGYLGKPHQSFEHIKNTLKGLTSLYKGAFKNLYLTLKPGGVLVAALPIFFYGHRQIGDLKSVIDWCETIGYTLRESLIYGRDGARIKRGIYVLVKKV